MSEKGKNPSERSKGGPKRQQMNQHLAPERQVDFEGQENESEQSEEALRMRERKPNRS